MTGKWSRSTEILTVIVTVCLYCVSFIRGQDSTTTLECPIYREFDFANPSSVQFGAPDGCRCIEGMSDLHCGYCETDAACQSVNSDYVCRSGVLYSEEDTYKSYQCDLTSTLETFFTNGKVSIFMNKTTGSGSLAIFNTETINDIHAINCNVTGCNDLVGTNTYDCDLIVCKCTDYCNSITKSIIDTMMTNKPVTVTIEDTASNSYLSVQMDGAPMDIEAICNASSCTVNPNVTSVDEEVTLEEIESSWSDAATFSLIVLVVIVGLTIVLLWSFLMVCLLRKSIDRRMDRINGAQATHDSQPISSNVAQILTFSNICRTVQQPRGQKRRKILNNISGSAISGTVTGIMGPSGAGKSSLLNILAAVDGSNSIISGEILLNGKKQIKGYRNKVAYVQQDDSLYETLTVRECVEYSALLRLPRDTTAATKSDHVDRTLEELGITHVANNRIGSNQGNGRNFISGGERKRVSIGMELVAQASVLICDEPITGLDSYAGSQVMKVLKDLATRNRIVILSIHQPSMKSFLLLDQVILLGEGRMVYNGKPSEVGRFLSDQGFPCPELETVADHVLDVISVKGNCDVLIDAQASVAKDAKPETVDTQSTALADEKQSTTGGIFRLLNDIQILFGRTAKDIFRNKELFLLQMTFSTALALLTGGIFSGVTNDLAGFQNRMGAFYFSLSFFAFASFSSMDVFVKERHIFVRETGSKYYGAFPYFLTKMVSDLLVLRVIPVSAFAFIFYWMMGLKSEPEAFIIFWATLVLFNVCAGSISICISIVTPTVGQANLIAAVWFLIMLLFGGFLLNVDTMSEWYEWLKYASIFYYSFEILMTNELAGLVLSFDAPGYPAIPVYGEVFLETIGMNVDDQIRDLICLCGLAAGFCVLAYLLLLFRVPRSAAQHFRKMERENKRLSRNR